MEHIPDCLVTLGLGLDADERSIRKAYAQRLKRIDQATDPQAFQALREAYEMALRWAAWQRERAAEAEESIEQEADESPATAQAPEELAAVPAERLEHDAPAQAPAVDQTAPEAIGEAVFAAFVARMDPPFKSEEEAQAALDAALADERLVNLEARAFFEWRVACRLVEGWRPGHEFLLGPACSTFHWDTERRQLSVFGRVGAVLNAAIDERLIFFRQAAGEFESQRQLIQRLRRGDAPPPAQLVDDMPRLRQLAQRYPHWLPIITPRAHAQRWGQWFDELPESARAAPRPGSDLRESVGSAPPKKRFSGGIGSYWWIVMIVLALGRLAGGLGGEPHARPVREWQQANHPSTRAQASTPEASHFPFPGEQAQPRRESALGEAPRAASAPKLARSTVPVPAATPPPVPSDLDRRQREAEAALQKALAEARQAALDSVTIAPAKAGGEAGP